MRVAILSREAKGGSTRRLVRAFESRGHTAVIFDTYRIGIELHGGKPSLRYEDKRRKRPDAAIARIGHTATFHGAAVLAQLEIMGVYLPVTLTGLQESRDKLRALQRLSGAGVPIPDTSFVRRRADLRSAIDVLGHGPLIVKVLQGTQGTGVLLAPDAGFAESMAETMLAANQPVLLQRFVAESKGRDVRAFVVGGEVVAAVRRTASGTEFRSNVHRGAVAEEIQIEDVYARTAVRACAALGLDIGGVDMLEGADGPLVVEVNSSPGIKGMEDSIGRQILAPAVVAHVEKRVAAGGFAAGDSVHPRTTLSNISLDELLALEDSKQEDD